MKILITEFMEAKSVEMLKRNLAEKLERNKINALKYFYLYLSSCNYNYAGCIWLANDKKNLI